MGWFVSLGVDLGSCQPRQGRHPPFAVGIGPCGSRRSLHPRLLPVAPSSIALLEVDGAHLRSLLPFHRLGQLERRRTCQARLECLVSILAPAVALALLPCWHPSLDRWRPFAQLSHPCHRSTSFTANA